MRSPRRTWLLAALIALPTLASAGDADRFAFGPHEVHGAGAFVPVHRKPRYVERHIYRIERPRYIERPAYIERQRPVYFYGPRHPGRYWYRYPHRSWGHGWDRHWD